MVDIDFIASQVKHNCTVSDARCWGYYSPCGLLLRLRDLYRYEHGKGVADKVDSTDIAAWIGKQENLWEQVSGSELKSLEIKGRMYRPFEIRGINAVLSEEGFVYGAGYDTILKPTFVLAELAEKKISGRYTIYRFGKELARDLSASPAMLLGNTIMVRHETMKLYLMNKYEEMKATLHRSALSHAFSEYGIPRAKLDRLSPDELERKISNIAENELDTLIHHEFGEASQRRLLGTWWKQLLLKLPHSRAGIFLRGLKDVLADTCKGGMLNHIIEHRKTGSLGFYVASLGGFRKHFFPALSDAYQEHMKANRWDLIESIRREGYQRARKAAESLKEANLRGRTTSENIENILLASAVPGSRKTS